MIVKNSIKGAVNLSEVTKPILLNDTRWPASEGWIKMQRTIVNSKGEKSVIHFVYNQITKVFDDFKFV